MTKIPVSVPQKPIPPKEKCDRHPTADATSEWLSPETARPLSLCGHCTNRLGPALIAAGWTGTPTKGTVPA